MSEEIVRTPKPSTVELLPDRVIKHFRFTEDFFRELEVYRLGLAITPRILEYRQPDWIALTRAAGKPYLDLEEGFDPASLAGAIATLHLARVESGFHLCHMDNQPANILYDGSRYTLLDFADSRMDHPATDITHLLLFWAEEFTPQRMRDYAVRFIFAYSKFIHIEASIWSDCLKTSRERFYQRRARFAHSRPKLDQAWRHANQLMLSGLVE